MRHYIHRIIEADWKKISLQFPALLLTGPCQIGEGTVVCLCSEPFPIDAHNSAVPVNLI